MLTLESLKSGFILILILLSMIMFGMFEIEHGKVKKANDKITELSCAITEQNAAVDKLKADGYAKDKKLQILDKKVKDSMRKAQQQSYGIMANAIPNDCHDAMRMGEIAAENEGID